jgi:hypothetical protein
MLIKQHGLDHPLEFAAHPSHEMQLNTRQHRGCRKKRAPAPSNRCIPRRRQSWLLFYNKKYWRQKIP